MCASVHGRVGSFVGSTPWPKVDWAEGVNGVTTQIRSNNHICSALVEGPIFTKACVQSLGMGMGRFQASNPTRPVGQPPFIMFQILVLSKDLLTCYSKLTHTLIMHIKQSTSHIIPKPQQHSSIMAFKHVIQVQQVYHKAASLITQQHVSQHSIKNIQHPSKTLKHSNIDIIHVMPNTQRKMRVHIHVHDLPYLPHCITADMHQCMYM